MSSDIALVWNNELMRADLAMSGPDLALDAGLQTAVTVSLLTDRQALPGDVLPDDNGPRGWWGDAYDAYPIGSRLWLLRRSVLTQNTLNAAQDYAIEALQWLIDDGVVGSVSVAATAVTINRMNLAVTISQNGASATYDVVWKGQAAQ
jgi:phage gp46-like protein